MAITLRQMARNTRRKLFPRRGRPAIGTVPEIAAVYDDVFTNDELFDILEGGNAEKLPYVLEFVRSIDGNILDAGCGRGSVLRFMLNNGIDAFGIELSKAACDMYLGDLPHANADIASWASQGVTYGGLVCLDVLEHVPEDQIDDVLDGLAKLAPTGLLGIANHSSIHNGHELHVLQRSRAWWDRKLRAFFSTVELVRPKPEDRALVDHFKADRFFFYRVSR
jgi:2-polyprenyl-3-methyl-5-hydroxy-6-metoxy-1,4-benzoquinol methylase